MWSDCAAFLGTTIDYLPPNVSRRQPSALFLPYHVIVLVLGLRIVDFAKKDEFEELLRKKDFV